MKTYGQIKILVNSCYDAQKLRIQTGNRIVANFRSKLGIESGEKPKDRDVNKLLSTLQKEYSLITNGMTKITRKFKAGDIISDYAELLLMHQYETLISAESKMFKDLELAIADIPVWKEYLKDVKGVGRAMAGVIIGVIDIEKATYPSSIWMYAGLDVAGDGRARSKRSEHLREYEYVNKDGETKTKKGITFNPFLKTKLIGVLGPSFLKARGKYSEIYYNYRNRLENRPDLTEHSRGHKHNMAIRYMVKQFIIDLHFEWRKIEGLPTSEPYHVAKLGIKHRAA